MTYITLDTLYAVFFYIIIFDTHKTRINGLSCGEESMTICSAVLIQYQRVTDGRTDVKPIAITCFSIADARKNVNAHVNVKIINNSNNKFILAFQSAVATCPIVNQHSHY